MMAHTKSSKQKTSPPVPMNEMERLSALQSLNILDSQHEQVVNDIATLAATICNTPIALECSIHQTIYQ